MTDAVAATTRPAPLLRELIAVRGTCMAVYVTPENGQPVALLVHGFSGSYGGMTYLTDKLYAAFRVVAIDLLCYGATDCVSVGGRSWTAWRPSIAY